MPDMLMVHAAAALAPWHAVRRTRRRLGDHQHGDLRREADSYLQNNAIVDRLFWWYAEQDFPTDRFDDISPMPKQIRVKAMSPLCHTSVSKWSLAAGVKDLHDQAKIERCAKVAGDVVYIVTTALNEFFDGKWVAPAWQPSQQIEHCIGCHGPGTRRRSAQVESAGTHGVPDVPRRPHGMSRRRLGNFVGTHLDPGTRMARSCSG